MSEVRPPSCARMKLRVDILQARLADMGVDLCGGNIRMAQHFLHGTQICAVFNQMGRE